MARSGSYYRSSIAFGPGPVSPAVKGLIAANVALFVAQLALPPLTGLLGLRPPLVLHLEIWRLVSYMFLHGGIWHILFNMLALWMFGTELERDRWGTRFFLKFYFVTGVGAAMLTVLFSLLPFGMAQSLQFSNVIGASGAIYGLLLAYGLYYPDRPIYMWMVFPIPARYFVMIMGALAFYSSLAESNGIANATHLGGLLVGYLYLKSARLRPLEEMKYWQLRWKMYRTRKKFDVYSVGRANDWNRRVH